MASGSNHPLPPPPPPRSPAAGDDAVKKPFQCTVCGKRYRKRHHLKYHEMKHTGEMPYQCSGCLHRFRTYQAFKSHCRSQPHGDSESDADSVLDK